MLKVTTATNANEERTLNTITIHTTDRNGEYMLLVHGIGSSKSRYVWLTVYFNHHDDHIDPINDIRLSELLATTLNNLTVSGVHLYGATTDIDFIAPSTADLAIDYLAGLWGTCEGVEFED